MLKQKLTTKPFLEFKNGNTNCVNIGEAIIRICAMKRVEVSGDSGQNLKTENKETMRMEYPL